MYITIVMVFIFFIILFEEFLVIITGMQVMNDVKVRQLLNFKQQRKIMFIKSTKILLSN